mmetsp:Transcript_33744/g.39316  ORF Transcript_33744/g.39316 Transcript_33744/m.39316 type:complete len:234 (+) Transcript_33744:431-1132(+)
MLSLLLLHRLGNRIRIIETIIISFLLHTRTHELIFILATRTSSQDIVETTTKSKLTILHSCKGYNSGHTFPCPCYIGMKQMNDDTVVFNQCQLGIRNGAHHGRTQVKIHPNSMGMAVYSNQLNLCGGKEGSCHCTCFDQDSVKGEVGFRTSISIDGDDVPGFMTDCLGLCGPNCTQGDGKGVRFASILVHDICQSFIRSTDAMPNRNACSDEGWSALSAAISSVIRNGPCPIS